MVNRPSIVVQDLAKCYDTLMAVEGLSFEVSCGEVFGLLGPNGAGKTTTIRMIMDIIKPDRGTIQVLGTEPGLVRGRVGYLPEERGLYRGLRVDECLIYLGQLKGLSRAEAARRAALLLERVELQGWARHKVQELSRGMQQKVQLIASLVHNPDLVIWDEPFQGLDPINVEMVKGMIRELRGDGKTIILSAHEMNQVEVMCDRIALIHRGRAVLYGELAEIKKQFSPNALDIRPPMDLAGWAGVARSEVRDGRQRVYLEEGTSPREFLNALLARGLWVSQFETASMSLDEIFIAVVK